ncbi:uncharacterized protein LOC115745288 [Rhodamnia argentea]|uniref:Uncharacterized protein LOC115745288 n=1 Tax=Rhodamnia argentea TaxID=178133 RepID=A0A8B8PPD4_9MYRT|nr:uncharacterized protein LOC115745288 [Rhodamnia argentea]
MSHSLNPASPPLAAATALSSKSNQKTLPPSIAGVLRACQQGPDDKLIRIHRRSVALGFVVGSLSLGIGEQRVTAAARRPPPSPPEEKRDPNVSGVQAKILASKKRKEAMKESIAKLREKGKPVNPSSE